MRIVHLTWGLAVGGAEAMLVDIANQQAAANDIWIIVGNRDLDLSLAAALKRSVRLRLLHRPPGNSNPLYPLKLIWWLRQIKADVVHAHQESFARFRRLISVPMLLTVHNTRLALSERLYAFDEVCGISAAVRDDVHSRFQRCEPRVILNGINFDAVRVKERYGGSPFRIVQVSRLAHEQKGQDLLIRALRIVLNRLGSNTVEVDFIGDGESLDHLRMLAAECDTEKQCRFLGLKTRQWIYQELQSYDLLVQPSRYEGFGLTIIEGIAAGLPVLVSNIEGPMEIIADGQLGWSFRSGDVEDLARQLLEVIAASSGPRFEPEMRSRAEHARRRFDVQFTAQQYLDVYAKLTRPHA